MSDLSKVKRDGKGHFIKGSYYAHWTGKTFSDEHMTNLKNRPSNRGVKKNFSPESKEKQLKQLEDMRSRHTDDFRSKEVREKIVHSNLEHNQECAKYKEKLENEGFKVIDIGTLKPDLIAVKDGKIYAYEVEYGRPKYKKYIGVPFFDDIIWVLKSHKTGKEVIRNQSYYEE